LSEFEHHMQQTITGQTALGSGGPMPNRGKG